MEHVLSHVITWIMMKAPTPPATTDPDGPGGTGCVLLACTPGEGHVLPLVVLSAALAERGIQATVLGAHTPTDTLAAAVDSVHSARADLGHPARPVVVVFALLDLADTASNLPAALHAQTQLVLAGPGWPTTTSRGLRSSNLQDTLELVSELT